MAAVFMADITDPADARHVALDLKPRFNRFGVFSLKYSDDGKEILAGSSDQHIYIYDLDRKSVAPRLLPPPVQSCLLTVALDVAAATFLLLCVPARAVSALWSSTPTTTTSTV